LFQFLSVTFHYKYKPSVSDESV